MYWQTVVIAALAAVAVNGNLYGINLNGINQNERAIRQVIDPNGFKSSFAAEGTYPLRAKRQIVDKTQEPPRGKRSVDFENGMNQEYQPLQQEFDPKGFGSSFAGDGYPLRAKRQIGDENGIYQTYKQESFEGGGIIPKGFGSSFAAEEKSLRDKRSVDFENGMNQDGFEPFQQGFEPKGFESSFAAEEKSLRDKRSVDFENGMNQDYKQESFDGSWIQPLFTTPGFPS